MTRPDKALQLTSISIWDLPRDRSEHRDFTTYRGLGSGWFFYNILRIESLGSSLLSSKTLPSQKITDYAFAAASDIEILRWCIKQPELCLKLDRQQKQWNRHRAEWLKMVSSFTDVKKVENILVQLWKSLLPNAFADPAAWSGPDGKEYLKWTTRLKEANGSIPVYAGCCLELESALLWRRVDQKRQALGKCLVCVLSIFLC